MINITELCSPPTNCVNHKPLYSQSNNTPIMWLYENAGQTPTTAIPAGVAVWAGDEGADEVTATGAQTADPGKTLLPGEPWQTSAQWQVSVQPFYPLLSLGFSLLLDECISFMPLNQKYAIMVFVFCRSYRSSSRSSSRCRSHSRSSRYSWASGRLMVSLLLWANTKSGHCAHTQ